MSQKMWTNLEIEKLKRAYANPDVVIRRLAKEMGRSDASVLMKAKKLKINCKWRTKHSINFWAPTSEEEKFMRESAGKLMLFQIAEKLGRCRHTVRKVLKKMGITAGERVYKKKVEAVKELVVKREFISENRVNGVDRIKESMARLGLH